MEEQRSDIPWIMRLALIAICGGWVGVFAGSWILGIGIFYGLFAILTALASVERQLMEIAAAIRAASGTAETGTEEK
jgi:hypothetical protein